MRTRKTKEEKFRLIADYKASGLSMAKWCDANGIPASTLAGWLRGKNTNTTKPKNKAKFVEVTLPTEPIIMEPPNITIEYKTFKISISADVDFGLLENTLRVVGRINV